MKEKINLYLELKAKQQEMLDEPTGNRIKKGGALEDRIKQVFKKSRVKDILTRSNKYTYEEFVAASKRFYDLKNELIGSHIIKIDDEGNETIKGGLL